MTIAALKALIPASARSRGIMSVFTGTFLISFDPVFIRLSGTGGFNTAFLFGFFTAISMFIVIQIREEGGLIGTLKASGWPVMFSGLLMLGSASSFVVGIKNTSVSNVMIIMSSAPVIMAVTSRIFLGEKTRKSTWLAIFFVLGGIAIVVSGSMESGNITGDALALFAVTCISLNQTLLRKYKNISRMASVGAGGLFLAVVMFFLAEPSGFSPATWLIMGVMGLLTAPLGRVLNGTATRYIPAPEVAMIMLNNAIFAPLWAYLLFSEMPVFTTIVGGIVILGTILSYILFTRNQIESS